jgi:hypothetical protein
VYNILGQIQVVLVDRELKQGFYTLIWRGVNKAGEPLPSGIYVVRLLIGEHRLSQKVLLLR